MHPRRGFASLAVAVPAALVSLLALGVLGISTSDGRAVTPKAGAASTRPPRSPTGHVRPTGRARAYPLGKRVRPRGPSRSERRPHAAGKSSVRNDKRSLHKRAHRAGDPGVTIADFSFTPAAITIHVGDTIQWLNNGPSAHTATADNGSFNTGVLKKGQSATVTFNRAGTYAYMCTIHPFMHGTVVVLAAAKAPSPSGSTSSGSPSSPSGNSPSGSSAERGPTGSTATSGTTAASGQGALPFTGVNVLALIALGLLLSGSGLALHRLRGRRLS